MISFEEARAATNGTWQGRTPRSAPPFSGVSTDSRSIQAGELFVALQGPSFDGHEFVEAAARRGAAAAVVSRDVTAPSGFPLLRVADTLRALADLARQVRAGCRAPVVAITGSVGKTTTKEMTAALLATRGPVLKTEGNLNNHIGLPLSLLRLRTEHTAVVLELGMSAPGELRELSSIARPDLAVITNVAPVHLEFFKNVDEIARAKAEILEGLAPGGMALLNHDDPRLRAVGEAREGQVVWFGTAESCQVRARDRRADGLGQAFELTLPSGSATVHLPLAGAHAMVDFLAAAAVAERLGLSAESIAQAAGALRPAPHRGSFLQLRDNVLLIDDCYNANPMAVEAASAVLAAQQDRRRVAFLGDMLELGPRALELHREVGERIASRIDVLVAMGALAQGFLDGAEKRGHDPSRLLSFEDAPQAAAAAASIVRPGDAVLVKASRGVRAEAVVDALVERFGVA